MKILHYSTEYVTKSQETRALKTKFDAIVSKSIICPGHMKNRGTKVDMNNSSD